jgi:hypothetical protein
LSRSLIQDQAFGEEKRLSISLIVKIGIVLRCGGTSTPPPPPPLESNVFPRRRKLYTKTATVRKVAAVVDLWRPCLLRRTEHPPASLFLKPI